MRGHMAAGTIACCITWALAAVPVARAQYGADGTITFAMHNKDAHDKTTTMTQYTRGQKTRMEFPDSTGQPAGAWIIDGSTSTMTILMIPNKQYIQITPQQVKDAAATVKPTADSLAKIYGDSTHKPPHMTTGVSTTNVKVAKVGTETVAGVSCDVFHVTTTDEKGKVQEGELCSAKGVGFFMLSTAMAGASAGAYGGAARNPAMQANYAQFAEVVGDGRGIIKITSIDKGTKHVEMEATRIDRSTPPDALFEVPPGYTKFEMPSLKSMLKGGASNSATNTSTSDSAKASQIAQKVADSASSTAAGGVKNALKKHLHFP